MKISVVIPCYRSAVFLPETLNSVLRQDRAPSEIIVIDDASPDQSVEVARRFAVTVLTSAVNGGPADARNRGIAAASGDVVAFLDADDHWEPDHLSRLAGSLERHPSASVAFSSIRVITGRRRRERVLDLPADAPLDLFWTLPTFNPVGQSGVMVRRAALEQVGGYGSGLRYSEDYDLWLRLARRHHFVYSPAVTLNHLKHGSGQLSDAMHRLYEGKWSALLRMRAELERSADARLGQFTAALPAIWQADLRMAWHERDPRAFRSVYALGAGVPGSNPVRARWAWRRWVIAPRCAAGRCWDRFPLSRQSGAYSRPINGESTPLTPVRGARLVAAAAETVASRA